MNKYEITVHMFNGDIARFYVMASSKEDAENESYTKSIDGFVANVRLVIV